jgi:hypothetical protein
MATSSATLHESEDRLPPLTRDLHRAIVSLMEELEAIDWYQQRVDVTQDAELREILGHNRDEEKEHAAMVLEWIRRRDPTFDSKLRGFLFTEGPITGREQALEQGNGGSAPAASRVTLGSLRGAQ